MGSRAMPEIVKDQIVKAAYRWIDTPYQHQASRRGAGTDCLGLVRGIWREIYGDEPMPVPPYSPDWVERAGEETLLNAAQNCLTPVNLTDTKAGHIMLFRMAAGAPCKHIAVRSAPDTIIHAYWGRAVVESYFVPYWQKRHAFSFAFPTLPKPQNFESDTV